jgi:hypothetical protein
MKKIVLPILAALAMAAQTSSDSPRFTPDGQLVLPRDYREWIYLSSGLGMTYGPAAQADQGNPMFDNVFVTPAAYKAFLESGRWPDKTMFILEVRRATGKGSINNGGHYQNDVVALEAAVKDETRFPQKWAYFGFGRSDKAVPLPANSACNSCHNQNAAVENTFVQFYPTLLEIATHKGTLNRTYVEKTPGNQ